MLILVPVLVSSESSSESHALKQFAYHCRRNRSGGKYWFGIPVSVPRACLPDDARVVPELGCCALAAAQSPSPDCLGYPDRGFAEPPGLGWCHLLPDRRQPTNCPASP